MSIIYANLPSPIGELLALRAPAGLVGLYFEEHVGRPLLDPSWREAPDGFRDLDRQLAEYFGGTRRRFELPLAAAGTAFQAEVWRALAEIPYAATRTYGAIASTVGRPTAFRAVGAATGRNPLSIVIPCHRVLGQRGALTGYAGGETRKRWLLELEHSGHPGV